MGKAHSSSPVVWQLNGHGLGDFILTTPTIRAIHQVIGKPVPVHFMTPWVKRAYRDCNFIECVHTHENYVMDTRGIGNGRQLNPDQEHFQKWEMYFHKIAVEEFGYTGPAPHTYIDQPKKTLELPANHILMIKATRDMPNAGKRIPPVDVYKNILADLLNRGYKPIFFGHESDSKYLELELRNFSTEVETLYLSDIREILSVLNQSKLIVSNITGLFHAAGAMRKRILGLWTIGYGRFQHPNPDNLIFNGRKNNWIEDFNQWIEEVGDAN